MNSCFSGAKSYQGMIYEGQEVMFREFPHNLNKIDFTVQQRGRTVKSEENNVLKLQLALKLAQIIMS